MNVTRSLLDDINTKQLKWYGHVQRMEEGRLPKQVMKCNPPGRRKRGRPTLTWMEGIRGLMGEKGLVEEDWNDKRVEKEDTISVQWAQEDVETSYNLLNNNNRTICYEIHHHHHHKHPGLGHLAHSVFRVTVALSIVSLVSQLFSFLVGCSGMI
jgi:hypothetical protein